jgi:CBS domain containing-hemolysin-like protein
LPEQFIILSVITFFLALCAGFEYVYVSRDNSGQGTDYYSNTFGLKLIDTLIKSQKHYISTILFVYISAFVVIGYLVFDLITHNPAIAYNRDFLLVIVALVSSFLFILAFGFFVPTILFRIWPQQSVNILSIPFVLVSFLSVPITGLLAWIAGLFSLVVFRRKNIDYKSAGLFEHGHIQSLNKQNNLQKESETEIGHDVKIFQNALDFSKVKIRDCAIPRNEIEAVELNTPIARLRERFIETGFSKILVYQDTIDNIIGYAQSTDMFKSPESILPILKNLMIAPETMQASKLLNLFLKEHKSIALVVDEFGGTFGLVTIEDVIEEIFGDIEDEHDFTDLKEEKISETEFVFSGRLEVDYINEKYNTNIPDSEEYATIAGFILHHNEEIPKENDKIKIGKFEFEILKLQTPKIELVKLNLLR